MRCSSPTPTHLRMSLSRRSEPLRLLGLPMGLGARFGFRFIAFRCHFVNMARRCGWDRDFKSSNRGSSGRRPSDISPVSPQKRSSATYLIFNATTAKKTVGTCHRHSRGLCINLLDVRSANFEESVSSEPEDDSDDHNRTSRWPSPCRESLTIGPVRNWVRSSSNPPLVIGSPHLALLSGLLGSSNHHEASGMTEEMLEIVIYCCRRCSDSCRCLKMDIG